MEDWNYTDMTVLVIDDQEIIRTIVEKVLRKIGFRQIEMAADGASGLEAVKAHRPDIIICDINMEPMDGFAFLKQLHKDTKPVGRKFPVIFLTSEMDVEVVTQAKELGVDAFVLKPVPPRILQEKIDYVLKRAHANGAV